MKGIRFRLTVRRLMALTVLIAVLLWGVQTLRRWQISRRAVAYYAYVEVAAFAQAVEAERRAAEARHQLAEILSVPDMQFSVNGREQTRAEFEADEVERIAQITAQAAELRAKSEHYERLKLRYERAARYPWLSVEPDPPDRQNFELLEGYLQHLK